MEQTKYPSLMDKKRRYFIKQNYFHKKKWSTNIDEP